MNGIAEALADPQVAARGLVTQVGDYRCVRGPLPTAAPPPVTGAPRLGQHTEEVLAGLGYGPDRLRQLREGGAIAGSPELDAELAHQ